MARAGSWRQWLVSARVGGLDFLHVLAIDAMRPVRCFCYFFRRKNMLRQLLLPTFADLPLC
jgi:hypothetical protein